MKTHAATNLSGRRVLIVESEQPFVYHLRAALEEEGAETVVVTDPYSFSGAERIASFSVCAAAINDVHRHVASNLQNVPVLIFGGPEPVPAEVGAVICELKRLPAEAMAMAMA